MNKKIVGIFVMTLLIATAVFPVAGTMNSDNTKTDNIYEEEIVTKPVKLPIDEIGLSEINCISLNHKSPIEYKDAEMFPKSRDTTGMCIDSNFYVMYYTPTTINDIEFHYVNIPNAGYISEVGKPAIPSITRYFEIPHDVYVSLEVEYADEFPFSGLNIIPAQPPHEEYMNATEPPITIDWPTYNTSEFYPSSVASIEGYDHRDPIIMRGVRLLEVRLNPVRFNPVTKELKLCSKIEVRIEYEEEAEVERIDPRLKSRAFHELCEGLVLNYRYRPDFEDDFTTPSLQIDNEFKQSTQTTTGANYLIITHDNFSTAINPLAEWKELKGLITKVVKTSDINPSGPTSTDIENYIQDAYNTWNPAPIFIILVGDSEFIPPSYKTAHLSDSHGGFDTPTDLYYSTVHGSDYIPDIFIGRISVDTSAQTTTIVNKILNYERTPPTNPDFYTDVSACAFFEDQDVWSNYYHTWKHIRDGFEDKRFVLTSEEIRDFFENEGYNVERIYCADNPAGQNPTNYNNGPIDFYDAGNPLPNDLLWPGFAWDGDTADITNAINEGRFLIYHRDHGLSRNFRHHVSNWWGWMDGWGEPAFDTGDIAGLTNGDLLPVIFSIECQCGWFDSEIDQNNDPALTRDFESYCEEFTRLQNGGAIAAFGAARNSQSGYNDDLIKGFIDAIWPGFDNDFASGGVFSLGQVLNYGKIFMLNERGYTDDYTKLAFENFHLFGDPELQIWTDSNEFDVIHPSSIGSGGSQTFVVMISDKNTHLPVNDAVVCVHKAGDIHEVVYTNPDGEAMFDISPSSPGNMDITVTKHNYIPYFNHIISITGDGTSPLTISLDHDFGPPGITVLVSGEGFQGNEDVKITFPGSPDEIITVGASSGGSFNNEPITVPSGSTGPVNVKGEGQSSGQTAVTLFRRLPDDRPEIFTYCQDDSSTWYLDPNNEKRWDSPCIQLYDATTGDPVSSYDLVSQTPYIINATIYNKGGLPADGVSSDLVTAENVWRDWGAGGPWNTGLSTTVSVPAASGGTYGKAYAEIPWTPVITGHICVQIELYHNWDADLGNNWGQENTRVEHAKSATEIKFQVTNPTNNTVVPYIEARTLDGTIWPSRVSRTVPQEQDPGESKEVTLTIDSPYNDGTQTFIATAYIDGETIGGVEARIIRGNGNQPPETPTIEGPRNGKPGTEYTYSIVADDPEGDQVTYWIEWGDGQEGWTSFHESEQKVKCKHTWSEESEYKIRVKARDIYDGESDWGTFEVNIPRNKARNFKFNLFEWLSERFLNLFPILRYMLGFQ